MFAVVVKWLLELGNLEGFVKISRVNLGEKAQWILSGTQGEVGPYKMFVFIVCLYLRLALFYFTHNQLVSFILFVRTWSPTVGILS